MTKKKKERHPQSCGFSPCKVKHSLVDSAYNDRRNECETALKELQKVTDIKTLGDLTEDNTYILVTLTAAADKKDTTVNLKAPLVINTDTRKGCQVIVEDDYPIKFNVYEAVKGRKKAEE